MVSSVGCAPETLMPLPSDRNDLETEVIEEVSKRAVRPVDITLQTEVYEDLGIYGMDVWEITLILHNKYGTDFSNLKLDEYVPPEGNHALTFFWRWLTGKGEYKSLTVGMLAAAVRQGRWGL